MSLPHTKLVNVLISKFFTGQTDKLTDWQTDRLTDWQTDKTDFITPSRMRARGNNWGCKIKFVEQCYLSKGFWVFSIWKVSRMVDVFCSIVAYMCGGECMEYNVIVCCATVRDRDDIGWLWCIAYSNHRKIWVSDGLWCIAYSNPRAL